MDKFFNILKKTLVGTMVVIFAFVIVYTPQQYDRYKTVETSEAFIGGILGGTAYITKEFKLDALGWLVAKSMVSAMLRSLINWVNSGFEGRPAFLTNLGDFLLEAADKAVGQYIEELGGIGSFLCSPFKLDIQIALALQYQATREGDTESTCSVSGIVDNIEDFIEGDFSKGGWEDWFAITSQPEQYTPYGQLLEAERNVYARIVNARGESLIEVGEIGQGFLSGKICEVVGGVSGGKERCTITKPGKVVQDLLTFGVDSNRQALIEADEFNELIAALIGQLANKMLTGAAGLLGLSAGTGYTYSGYDGGSYIDAMVQETNQLVTDTATAQGDVFTSEIALHQEYNTLASSEAARLAPIAADEDSPNQARASDAIVEAVTVQSETSRIIATITTLHQEYLTLSVELESPSLELAERAALQSRQAALISELTLTERYVREEVEASRASWAAITE